jgi:hypothetical protein
VLKRLWNALRVDGILYASFKYGEGIRIDKDRLFFNYEETTLNNLMINNGFLINDIF